jgi:hypothetical protein
MNRRWLCFCALILLMSLPPIQVRVSAVTSHSFILIAHCGANALRADLSRQFCEEAGFGDEIETQWRWRRCERLAALQSIGASRPGWKLLWRPQSRPGRPAIRLELRALIGRIAKVGPSWGRERGKSGIWGGDRDNRAATSQRKTRGEISCMPGAPRTDRSAQMTRTGWRGRRRCDIGSIGG